MNDNPWHIDDMARMERERIQEEMREIRMAQAASRPHAARLNVAARLLVQLLMAIQKWLHRGRQSARGLQPRPHVRLHVKTHTHA